MTDADRFRALAARCVALRQRAKRADVQEALHALAREYTAEARAAVTPAGLPAAWPMLAIPRHFAELWRVGLAFWLSP